MTKLGIDDNRQAWRKNWLLAIREFSDLDEQRREWLAECIDSPYYTFVEYMCRYFDDLLLDDNYRRAIAEGLVSEFEARLVERFHTLADAYVSPTDADDDAAILADSKWQAVVAAAEEARQALCESLTDPGEILVLKKTSH